MDLRRAVFLKKPLLDSSINSLNSSSVSLYESAAEDSENSIYYSFADASSKTIDKFMEDENHEISVISEADKENTVIMKDITDEEVTQVKPTLKSPVLEIKNQTAEKVEVIHDDLVINISDNSTLNETQDKMDVDTAVVESEKKEEKTINIETVEPENEKSDNDKTMIPEIVVEDPNQNIINPFTISATEVIPSSSTVDFIQHSTPEQTMQANDLFKKKSASKIPTRSSHFYSPVQRKSIDRKTKINVKPQGPASKPQRRTVYETRSRLIEQAKPKSTIITPAIQPLTKPTKTVSVPKTAAVNKPKPALYKCTFPGCNRDFRLLKTYQDHQKIHSGSNGSSSSSSSSPTSFKCKWCDKVFNIESALTGHKLEKCPKIPFNEKRKLIAQEEAKEKNTDKRKSIFVAPVPKKQSPQRRKTLNKSGVIITPKKTLKCSQCHKLFTDVLEFANHTIGHKYDKVNQG